MTGSHATRGVAAEATGLVGRAPGYAATLVLGTLIAGPATLVWGIHPGPGWHRMRERAATEGLVALGEVLAPAQGRADYADGIWKGLWRVHGAAVGFGLLQLPVILVAAIPIAAISFPLTGAASLFYTRPLLAGFIGSLSAIVALAAALVVAGQAAVAYRHLGALSPPHRLGTLFHAHGVAWQDTLRHMPNLLGLIGVGLLSALAAGGLVAVNILLARAVGIERLDVVAQWSGTGAGLLWFALQVELMGRWSTAVASEIEAPTAPYSFGDWIVSWLGQVWDWLSGAGTLILAVACCMVVALTMAVQAVAGGAALVDLVWFVVAGLFLLILQIRKGDA